MGWHGHALGNDWYLYTRGGTNGVFLQKREGPDRIAASEEIAIPSALLRMLVAEDIRAARISRYEQMDTATLLGLDAETRGREARLLGAHDDR